MGGDKQRGKLAVAQLAAALVAIQADAVPGTKLAPEAAAFGK